MGFFNRNRQASERVQDLKNRVESLRKVDDAHRALTLDDFLAGDDAVTARIEPRYAKPAPEPAPSVADENALEAELQRYLQNHVESEELEAADTVVAAPDFEPSPVPDESPPVRPISIDEFPPLPPVEDAFKPHRDALEPSSPPRRVQAISGSDRRAVERCYGSDVAGFDACRESAPMGEARRGIVPCPESRAGPRHGTGRRHRPNRPTIRLDGVLWR